MNEKNTLFWRLFAVIMAVSVAVALVQIAIEILQTRHRAKAAISAPTLFVARSGNLISGTLQVVALKGKA